MSVKRPEFKQPGCNAPSAPTQTSTSCSVTLASSLSSWFNCWRRSAPCNRKEQEQEQRSRSADFIGGEQRCIHGLHAGRAGEGAHQPGVNAIHVVGVKAGQEPNGISILKIQHADHTPAAERRQPSLTLQRLSRFPRSFLSSGFLFKCKSVRCSWKNSAYLPLGLQIIDEFID